MIGLGGCTHGGDRGRLPVREIDGGDGKVIRGAVGEPRDGGCGRRRPEVQARCQTGDTGKIAGLGIDGDLTHQVVRGCGIPGQTYPALLPCRTEACGIRQQGGAGDRPARTLVATVVQGGNTDGIAASR
ncbi:MAG: hypothetical protein JAZ17_22140 [Candidatus Thiodiazotropha endolucinida]|nr:hypothetical protein [Candidatus Thiodiazotropha taylori]MCG8096286.1 hypothetical protein [Candidatus Thiodiazotropha endolucinida]MCW4264109.1 hypothetical protein [Candidatus Thiodiazotropha endolucinida]